MAKHFKPWILFLLLNIYITNYYFVSSQEYLKFCKIQSEYRITKAFCTNVTDSDAVIKSVKNSFSLRTGRLEISISNSNITQLKYSSISSDNEYRFSTIYEFKNNIINTLEIKIGMFNIQFINNTILNLTSVSNDRHLLFMSMFRLNLSNNNIKYISPDVFSKISSYPKNINMMNCGLTELPKGLFTSSQSLNTVIFSNNNFSVIPKDTFVELERITQYELLPLSLDLMTLSLDHCNIDTIEEEAFQRITMRKLNISYNNIKTLNENIFVECVLHNIDLRNNQIEQLKPDIFAGLKTSLETVNLRSNKISVLPSEMFKSNTELKHLDLMDNPIKNIEGNAFLGLKKLNIKPLFSREGYFLLLPRIEMKHVVPNVFNGLQSLVILNLSNHTIEHVYPNTFKNLLSLENLNLSYNNIQEILPETFLDLNSIRSIDLSHNNINELDVNSFLGLEKTERLLKINLSYNQLEHIPVGLFTNTPTLSELILNNNNISYLDYGTFSGLKFVHLLDLSYNQLSDIYKEVLYPLLSLKYLSIESNNISQMDIKHLLDHNKNLKQINLNDNPWTCSYLKGMIREFFDNEIDFLSTATEHYSVHNIHGIACSEIEDSPHDDTEDTTDIPAQLNDLIDKQYELVKEQVYQNTLTTILNWIVAFGFIMMAVLYAFFNRNQLFNWSSNQSLARRSEHGSQVELINIK